MLAPPPHLASTSTEAHTASSSSYIPAPLTHADAQTQTGTFPLTPPGLPCQQLPSAITCEGCHNNAITYCLHCYSPHYRLCFDVHCCGMTHHTPVHETHCLECGNLANKRCLICIHPVCHYCTDTHDLYRHNRITPPLPPGLRHRRQTPTPP